MGSHTGVPRPRTKSGSRQLGGQRGKPKLTRRGRIALWAAGTLAVLVLAAGGAGGWLYQRLDGNINASDIDDKVGGGRPINLSPGAKNILLVGSDSREGAIAKYGKDLATMQSDTLMVLHIAANRKWAAVVSP